MGGSPAREDMVLVVCLHGAAKSLIAASHLARLARERGIGMRAEFAGAEPDPELMPAAVAGLEAEGIDVRGQRPRRVTAVDIRSASRVVSFSCDLAALAPRGSRELPRRARRDRVSSPRASGAFRRRGEPVVTSRESRHSWVAGGSA